MAEHRAVKGPPIAAMDEDHERCLGLAFGVEIIDAVARPGAIGNVTFTNGSRAKGSGIYMPASNNRRMFGNPGAVVVFLGKRHGPSLATNRARSQRFRQLSPK